MKICVPIMASHTAEALSKMKQGFALADMVELRIDGLLKVELDLLLASRKGELLITNRTKKEGGAFSGTEKARVAFLQKAVALGADYVDLEIGTDKVLRDKLRQKIESGRALTRLILSCHSFERTPGLSALKIKLEEGRRGGADIVKIVSYAKKAEDNLRALALIPYARKRGLPIITFCMGPSGKMSRIMAPLLGSYLTYASLGKGEESAPGQMTVKEMRQVVRILQGRER